jgi:hypothetical protein
LPDDDVSAVNVAVDDGTATVTTTCRGIPHAAARATADFARAAPDTIDMASAPMYAADDPAGSRAGQGCGTGGAAATAADGGAGWLLRGMAALIP